MATKNPFDIFEDVEYEDPSQLVAAVSIEKLKKTPTPPPVAAVQQAKPAAKLPSKPAPPAQAEVREARNESGRGRGGRGGGGGGGRGYGQGRGGGRGYDQDSGNNEGRYGGNDRFSGDYKPREEGDVERRSERRGGGGPRGPPFRGGRRGGFNNGEAAEGERPRRTYERHSGTGRGNELKREGSGRGNWGSHTDDVAPDVDEAVTENEKNAAPEKPVGEEEPADATKETAETEEKEPEDNEMTLEEYQKVLEEKRKALLGERTEERKVEVDKDLKAMQQLSSKKGNHDDIFIKLGAEKDKRKEVEKEERAKKVVSINEFLKPAEGEKYFGRGGRGRGRGRGGRGGDGESGGGGFRGSYAVPAPKIEDPSHFPSLGGK